MFIVLMSYRWSLVTKLNCPENNQTYMTQLLSLIDLNLTELNNFLFMISQGQCNWSCNVVDLSMKIFVATKTKDVNIKVFNTITGINEVQTLNSLWL